MEKICTVCDGRGGKGIVCEHCGSSGIEPTQCTVCNGTGQLSAENEDLLHQTCWRCNGTGIMQHILEDQIAGGEW